MKPLYLRGTEPLTVSLDGPALRVAQPCKADRRYPLRRVSRVVVSNHVSWSTDALLACADEGITVCFLSGDGTPRARWTGRPSPRSEFLQRWHDFVDRPDWHDLYAQWSTAARRRAVRFCALRMGWSPRQDARVLIRIIADSAREVMGNDEFRALKKKLHSLAQARALAELSNMGLGANDDAISQIIPDLATGIQWGLHPDLSQWISARMRNGDTASKIRISDPHTAIRFFERYLGTCDFHLRDTLRYLQRYIQALQ